MVVMGAPRTTVLVTVREGYSRSLESLRSLLASTPEPFRLVWVASGAPGPLRRELERAARERGFMLVTTSRYLSPNEARNVGLQYVDTEFVVLSDNDVIFEPGWLTSLLATADETGAALVGPLYCVGRPSRGRVHMAGGASRIVETAQGREFFEDHYFHERDLVDVAGLLTRGPTGLIEFHCMLARTSVLERLGPLDEGLISLCEHNDLCMRVRQLGEEVWFEPSARVTYVPTIKSVADYLCFCYRWRDRASRATIDHFWQSWDITPTSPMRMELMRFTREHRALGQPRPRRINAAISARVAAAFGELGRPLRRPPRVVVKPPLAAVVASGDE